MSRPSILLTVGATLHRTSVVWIVRSLLVAMVLGSSPVLACEDLFASHGHLVGAEARRARRLYQLPSLVSDEDLQSASLEGLVAAVQAFKDDGTSFGAFARVVIRRKIIDWLRQSSDFSRSEYEFRKKAKSWLEQARSQGLDPSRSELAASLGVSVEYAERCLGTRVSLDAPVAGASGPGDAMTWSEVIAAKVEGRNAEDVAREWRELLPSIVGGLATDILICHFVYGLGADPTGHLLGFSANTIIDKKNLALRKLATRWRGSGSPW